MFSLFRDDKALKHGPDPGHLNDGLRQTNGENSTLLLLPRQPQFIISNHGTIYLHLTGVVK
jgi:hypothetical protein